MSIIELRKQVKDINVPYSSRMTREQLESFLSDEKYSLGWRWKYIKPFLQSDKEARGVVKMLLSPVRNIRKLKNKQEQKRMKEFRGNHHVRITMTTSPLRLPKIVAVLATLDLSNVRKINIILPMQYGKDKQTYDYIPDYVVNFPKVKIIRIAHDLGPITKMLPSIARAIDKKSLLLSIDDDVAYPLGMVNEMIYQKVIKLRNSVLTMGTPMPFFTKIKNMRKYWPERHQKRPFIDIVEGWSSVLYAPELINTNCMRKLSELGKPCLLSDDFVISYALAQTKVKRARVNNQYAYNPMPYDYGAGEDALHAGRDLDGKKRAYEAHSDDINFEKYTECLKNIRDYVDLVRRSKRHGDSCNFRQRNPNKRK